MDRHGINPADDCTLLQFFSEVNKLLLFQSASNHGGNSSH